MIEDLVVEVHEVFARQGIDHAFGGALALAQYAEPRGTIDVDVNVATVFSDRATVVDLLGSVGFRASVPEDQWLPVAGARFSKPGEIAPLDVFFAFDEYHGEVLRRARTLPFPSSSGTVQLPFLDPEDLVVMKLSFNRPKDWVDVQAMADTGTPLDPDTISERLVRFRGVTMYPRTARLRRLLAGD